MNITEKKAFSRRIIETVWNEGKVDGIENFLTPNLRYTDASSSLHEIGIEALKQHVLSFRKAFPDAKFKIDDQIAEGDKLVTLMTVTATHEGEFMGLPASHKNASLPAIAIERFDGDKVAEVFVLWDTMTFLRTAGGLPLHEPALAAR